ncbi:MAG: glycerol-3-phosphate 1-O-acyltransferase PlsY [Erysipelotrichaceae bacterium]
MLLLACLLGYFLGSLPFALIIGKVFYNTDVRNFGSGNLGASNAGRVLGKNAAIAVSVLDVLKVVFAIWVTTLFSQEFAIFAGVFASIGHCYPIFAKFKGGKAVSTMFGFLFGMSAFVLSNPWMFLIPLAVFFGLLKITKIVSLSSMITSVFVVFLVGFVSQNIVITIALVLLSALIIFRHRGNIAKIKNGTENKIKWM